MSYYKLDKNCNPVPCTFEEWAQSLNAIQRVKRTRLNDGEIEVSTVFLGLDHRFTAGKKPILWETMIFAAGQYFDQYMARSTSKKQALKNHYRVVKAIKYRRIFSLIGKTNEETN